MPFPPERRQMKALLLSDERVSANGTNSYSIYYYITNLKKSHTLFLLVSKNLYIEKVD